MRCIEPRPAAPVRIGPKNDRRSTLGRNRGRAGMGRPPGARNRMPRELREAIIEAATLAGGEGGLVGYLTRMAKEHPVAFVGLLGRVLAIEVRAPAAAAPPVSVIISWAGE